MSDEETLPQVITPLESKAIQAALPSVLPAINWIIYATNLDEVLHITKLTTNQLWQGLNAVLVGVSIVMVIVHRVKQGNDPNNPAPKIMLRKPKDEFSQIAAAKPVEVAPPPPPEPLSPPVDPNDESEMLLESYKLRMRKFHAPPQT